jgi:site-specific DNA recombinase
MLKSTLSESEARRQEVSKALQQKLATVRTRMDQLHEDKLDGKISEEFWSKKQSGLHDQELAIEAQIWAIKAQVRDESILSVERVFELANTAHSLYFTRNTTERAELLKTVLLNCTTD